MPVNKRQIMQIYDIINDIVKYSNEVCIINVGNVEDIIETCWVTTQTITWPHQAAYTCTIKTIPSGYKQ